MKALIQTLIQTQIKAQIQIQIKDQLFKSWISLKSGLQNQISSVTIFLTAHFSSKATWASQSQVIHDNDTYSAFFSIFSSYCTILSA